MPTLAPHASAAPSSRAILMIGKESVGKTQLIASLTGRLARSENFRGSTVAVERYETADAVWVDTPGIVRASDIETTRQALAALAEHDSVVLVAQGTHLDEDLAELLPLTLGKRAVVAVTFWDKVAATPGATEALNRLTADLGLDCVPLDARRLTAADRSRLLSATAAPRVANRTPQVQVGWQIEPRPGWFEHRLWGPLLAVLLLALPAALTIILANGIAARAEPVVQQALTPVLAWAGQLPTWLAVPLAGKFGLLAMGPFLFVWAMPTVLLYALFLGVYKASGLVERLNSALHPWLRPFGLSGRDAVRVMMGLGCNVPAVISTRSCSACSRGVAMSAIAFGAACSYQMPATLAVLAAGGWHLAPIFLAYLTATTLVYLRLTSPQAARNRLNVIVERRTFLVWPQFDSLWREVRSTLEQFLRQALPVFVLICVAAAWLEYSGALPAISGLLAPVIGLFNLPAEASVPVVLSAIRKDGIFLFLAEGQAGAGLATPMTSAQILTGVYLAGVLLPCLVTLWTIRHEAGWRFAARLAARQAAFASLFALLLAWSPRLLGL